MQKHKTFLQAVRDFWRIGKTGIALFLVSLFALIYGYIALDFEITQGWNGHVSVQNVIKDISSFIPVDAASVATIIGVIDLMMLLSDYVDARRQKRIEAAAAAAKAEGKAEGKAEVYREIAEWDRRRREAEERGEEFTEPPPTQLKANGLVEGIAVGKAEVYREIAEWDRRRKDAEERGQEFTEPPPTQPMDNSEAKSEE